LRLNYTSDKIDGFLGASVYQETLDSRSAAVYDEEAFYRDKRLSRAPGVSGSASADYTFDISKSGSVLLGSEARFRSRQFFNPDNSAIQTGRAYTMVDARLTWTSTNSRAGDQRRFGVRAAVEL